MNGPIKIMLVFAVLATAALGLGSGIKWEKNLANAMKVAKKLKKPIMIDFYGDY